MKSSTVNTRRVVASARVGVAFSFAVGERDVPRRAASSRLGVARAPGVARALGDAAGDAAGVVSADMRRLDAPRRESLSAVAAARPTAAIATPRRRAVGMLATTTTSTTSRAIVPRAARARAGARAGAAPVARSRASAAPTARNRGRGARGIARARDRREDARGGVVMSAGTSGDEPVARDPKDYKIATKLAHAKTSVTDPYGASAPPLYQTATFAQPSATENGPYDYTRSGNPTRTQLEEQMANLECADRAFSFS
jgi:hypothetical protein